MRQSYKTFFLWAVLILLFFSFYSIFSRQRSNEPKEIDASEFYAAVDRGEVASTTVKGSGLPTASHMALSSRVTSLPNQGVNDGDVP